MGADSNSTAARIAFLLLTGAAASVPAATAMAQSVETATEEAELEVAPAEGSAEAAPIERRRLEENTKRRNTTRQSEEAAKDRTH